MRSLLSLTIGDEKINAPGNIPTGGINQGETVLQNGIGVILVLISIFALFMLIWGGIIWITSAGDKAKLDAARKRIIYAIIGLILAFLSFTIISLVGSIFGVELLGTMTRQGSVDCPSTKGGAGQAPCNSPYGPYCRSGYDISPRGRCQ